MDTKQELQVQQKRELDKREESTIPGACLCRRRTFTNSGRPESHSGDAGCRERKYQRACRRRRVER